MADLQATTTNKFGWRLWLGLAFSIASVWLVLRGVDLGQLAHALRQMRFYLLILALLSVVLTFLAKAARWRLLFADSVVPPLSRAFAIICIGMLVNSFLPARLGEVVRAYLIGERGRKSYALGTIVVEKVSDLVFLVVSVAILLTQHSLPPWLVEPARMTVLVMLVAVFACLFLAWWDEPAVRLLAFLSRVLPLKWRAWLDRQVRLGLTSLKVLRQPGLVLRLLSWSAFVWILGALTNYLVFLGMGLALPASVALLLLVVLQAGVAVPSSPGRLGVFHYLTVLTLSLFAVGKEEALGYAVVLHLVVYLPMLILGLWYLWREGDAWQRFWPTKANLRGLMRKGT